MSTNTVDSTYVAPSTDISNVSCRNLLSVNLLGHFCCCDHVDDSILFDRQYGWVYRPYGRDINLEITTFNLDSVFLSVERNNKLAALVAIIVLDDVL